MIKPDHSVSGKSLQQESDLQLRVSAEVQITAVIAAGTDHIPQHKGHARLLQTRAMLSAAASSPKLSWKALLVQN